MNKKCPNCNLINFLEAVRCHRCGADIEHTGTSEVTTVKQQPSILSKIIWRAFICIIVCLLSIFGFYLSLILTSAPVTHDEKKQILQAIQILRGKGFSDEAFLLNYLTSFRGNDHWLNASIEKENAYAATNYPFEIMTIYPDFFTYTVDDVERSAILLHEAKHLQGADEKDAYEFVWKNRQRLGWTRKEYSNSVIWQNVRKQTREVVPNLFVCPANPYNDCTEMSPD